MPLQTFSINQTPESNNTTIYTPCVDGQTAVSCSRLGTLCRDKRRSSGGHASAHRGRNRTFGFQFRYSVIPPLRAPRGFAVGFAVEFVEVVRIVEADAVGDFLHGQFGLGLQQGAGVGQAHLLQMDLGRCPERLLEQLPKPRGTDASLAREVRNSDVAAEMKPNLGVGVRDPRVHSPPRLLHPRTGNDLFDQDVPHQLPCILDPRFGTPTQQLRAYRQPLEPAFGR